MVDDTGRFEAMGWFWSYGGAKGFPHLHLSLYFLENDMIVIDRNWGFYTFISCSCSSEKKTWHQLRWLPADQCTLLVIANGGDIQVVTRYGNNGVDNLEKEMFKKEI